MERGLSRPGAVDGWAQQELVVPGAVRPLDQSLSVDTLLATAFRRALTSASIHDW